MFYLANTIQLLIQIYTIIVIIHVVLSYFLPVYHPVREFIDRLVEPLLSPIRRTVPPVGMFDLSPLILIFALQIVESLITRILFLLN